ncbi:hypothetical protein BJ166DRAFT_621077 [Pestalotiopsis sp. NC0098]|nr:hypothetical protein BJ166DRAFT_621077 [Pestalotiopsis sp. NC0098]
MLVVLIFISHISQVIPTLRKSLSLPITSIMATGADPPNSTRNYGEFFAGFSVVYDDDKPYDTINEIHGESADINKGQGGKYVWLRAHKANNPRDLVTSVSTAIVDSARDGQSDLAAGAGGSYRYFETARDAGASRFITEVALWRSGDRQSFSPEGWQGISGDINDGRGGDYLYFVWKTKLYVGPME